MVAALDFRLRRAEPGDLAALDALFLRSYPRLLKADYPPSVMVTAVPLLCKAQPALVASGTFHVAVLGSGTLIGAGGWTARRGDRGVGDVRHMVCDPAHLRRGVARAILMRSLTEAAARGLQVMDCKATHTAVPFYRALGFEVVAPIEVPLRPGIVFPAVQMMRRL